MSLNPRNVLPQIHTDIPPQCLKTPLLHLHHHHHHAPQTLVMEKRTCNRIRSFIAPFEHWYNWPCRSWKDHSYCCTRLDLEVDVDVRQLRNIFRRRGERILRITIKLIKLPRKRLEELLFLLPMLSIERINDITPTSIVLAMQITLKT